MYDIDVIETYIGKVIRKLREGRRLSRTKFALLSGVSEAALAQIECRGHLPTTYTMLAILNAFNMDMETFQSLCECQRRKDDNVRH